MSDGENGQIPRETPGRCPRLNNAVTTEPRTESRTEVQSEPDQAWPRARGRTSGPAGPGGTSGPGGPRGPGSSVGPPPASPRGAVESYREIFAIGEFRAIWSAQVLSCAGNQVAQVAIAILVYGRTHSPFLTALAYALTYLPPIAGGPLLSGLADLFPRRRVMITCDLLRVGTVGLMAIPAYPRRPVRPAVLHRTDQRAVFVGADCPAA